MPRIEFLEQTSRDKGENSDFEAYSHAFKIKFINTVSRIQYGMCSNQLLTHINSYSIQAVLLDRQNILLFVRMLFDHYNDDNDWEIYLECV